MGYSLISIAILTTVTMKILVESIRSFWEGFSSFYTTIYDEIRSW
jgi:Flp pilus assembly pilin Flp